MYIHEFGQNGSILPGSEILDGFSYLDHTVSGSTHVATVPRHPDVLRRRPFMFSVVERTGDEMLTNIEDPKGEAVVFGLASYLSWAREQS